MNNRSFAVAAGLGCSLLLVALVAMAVAAFFFLPFGAVFAPGADEARSSVTEVAVTVPAEMEEEVIDVPAVRATQSSIPTLPAATAELAAAQAEATPLAQPPGLQLVDDLTVLYDRLSPGVVNINTFVEESVIGGGTGSGFILDEAGHIVTNHHVVTAADRLTVIFSNGIEREAEVIGSDDDSDLAVIRVDELPEGTHPLPVADSNLVEAGQWAVAIGNPFSFGGSMTLGIVSAVGRAIPSGFTLFSIPQVIQTDAAINPGNSGGPLLNLSGEVIGVNAQIRTADGVRANSGVGFAIPSNVVRLVVPVLIEQGSYQWPYLGVSSTTGISRLARQRANNLPDQRGAFIDQVPPDGPAAEAGLQGATGEEIIFGQPVPVGGDIVVGIDGRAVEDFADLLTQIAFSQPGETVTLTVYRDGETLEIPVTLSSRPDVQQP